MSEEWTLRSLESLKKMMHGDGVAAQTLELAELRKAEGRIAEARQFGEEALERFRELNSQKMLIEVQAFLAGL